MENFGKSMLSLMKYNFNEMKKMVEGVNLNELEEEFNNCKKNLMDSFNDLKSKIVNKNGNFIIEVPYDRDNQTISFSIKEDNGNVFSVDVKPCEDCEESSIKSTFSSKTTLPKGVLTERITHNYNKELKKMSFIFETNENFDDSNVNELKSSESEEILVNDNKKNEDQKVTFENSINKIMELYNNGWSFRKISKEMGVSDKTIAKWIRKKLN